VNGGQAAIVLIVGLVAVAPVTVVWTRRRQRETIPKEWRLGELDEWRSEKSE
jgi:uncharacterized membrane protein